MSDSFSDAMIATRDIFLKEWEGKLYKPASYQQTLDSMNARIAARILPKHKIKATHLSSKISSAFKTIKLTCKLDSDQQKRIWKILQELESEL